MATRIEAKPSAALHERDVYAWSKEQANLLRARRFAEIDLDNLIEEVEDLGESLYRSACSRLRMIIEHLLKLQHSPARSPRPGWVQTVYTQRSDLEDELTASVRPRLEQALPQLYRQARRTTTRALQAHGEQAEADALPATCPYSLDQITGDWLP